MLMILLNYKQTIAWMIILSLNYKQTIAWIAIALLKLYANDSMYANAFVEIIGEW